MVEQISILPEVSLTRITPPSAVSHFLYRERLIERLNRPAPRSVFVVAPSGFGKTVLASQWAAQIETPLFWYTVDARDSAEDSIFHIIQGLRIALPGFAPWAEELIGTELNYVDIARRLAHEIGRLKSTLTMIWDGVDKFPSEFTPALGAFSELAPINLRTLSLRGSMPNQSFARAAKLDALDFITGADLRFDRSELESIAAKSNLDVSNPTIATAFEGVQGWPAGVQILLNRLHDQKPIDVALIQEEFIISSTLKNISARDRAYLEPLLFLEEITLDIVQRLNPFPIISSEEHPLLRLSKQGIFINEIRSGVFAINSLIREGLLRDLAVDTHRFHQYGVLTAELYESEDKPISAIEIYAQIKDDQQVIEKSYTYMSRIINGGEAQLLKKWGRRISPLLNLNGTSELNQAVLDAYVELMTGKNQEVLASCINIENGIRGLKDPHSYIVEIWGLRARASFNLGNFTDVLAIADEMLASPLTQKGYGAASIRITNVLRLAVSASFLREDFEATMRYAKLIDVPGDAMVNAVIVPTAQAQMALADGRYKRAFEFANAALTSAIRYNIVGVFSSFDAVYVMADYYRESGEEEAGILLLDEYIDRAKKHGVWSWYLALMGKKALIKSQQGQINEALNILRVARDSHNPASFDTEIFRILDEQELLIRVKIVDSERIGELLYRMPQTATTTAFSTAYAARKNPSSAKSILEKYPSSTPRLALTKALISAEAFKDHPKQAIEYLITAVQIAMENGARNIFLNQSREVQNLLLDLANQQPTVYMEQLASLIRKGEGIGGRDQMGLAEPLTKREIDILRRLSSGLPITQIAGTLHISHNTIKTHLKSVYRKLKVESRSEAVERGKELLLL